MGLDPRDIVVPEGSLDLIDVRKRRSGFGESARGGRVYAGIIDQMHRERVFVRLGGGVGDPMGGWSAG